MLLDNILKNNFWNFQNCHVIFMYFTDTSKVLWRYSLYFFRYCHLKSAISPRKSLIKNSNYPQILTLDLAEGVYHLFSLETILKVVSRMFRNARIDRINKITGL